MLTAFALALLIGGPALALSCLPPDVVRTYQEAAQSKAEYVVAHGKLVFDASELPEVDWDRQQDTPPETLIAAQFTGNALSQTGFDHPFDQSVTLIARCFGPWCAGAEAGRDYLAFLERRDDGYFLDITPCGGFGFPEPSPEMLDQVVACFQGKRCRGKPLR